MKAYLISEIKNFERSGDSLDKLNIGLGANKHIKELEKILNLIDVKWEKEPIDEGFQWHIRWNDKKEKIERYIYVKLISRQGWTYPGNMGELLETPFEFMNFLIDEIYGNIPNVISELNNKILKLKKAEHAKNILKKYINES